jgi:chorismate dehydratase
MKQEKKKLKRYRISIVNYTNTLPFKYGISQSGFAEQVELHFDMPAACAQKLIEGTVDIGLVPVAILPQLGEYHILGSYCLGSNGPVDTVKLYSQSALEKIETILLDYQSRSSVSLVQLLSKYYWKIAPRFVQAKEGFETQIAGTTAAVVIGDRCFDMNGKFAHEYDLAGEWKQHTGMPFVFAAWVSNKPVDPVFAPQFERALEYGLAHMEEAILKNIAPGKQELVRHYLTRRIDYRFDAEKRRSMEHFLTLLKESSLEIKSV